MTAAGQCQGPWMQRTDHSCQVASEVYVAAGLGTIFQLLYPYMWRGHRPELVSVTYTDPSVKTWLALYARNDLLVIRGRQEAWAGRVWPPQYVLSCLYSPLKAEFSVLPKYWWKTLALEMVPLFLPLNNIRILGCF